MPRMTWKWQPLWSHQLVEFFFFFFASWVKIDYLSISQQTSSSIIIIIFIISLPHCFTVGAREAANLKWEEEAPNTTWTRWTHPPSSSTLLLLLPVLRIPQLKRQSEERRSFSCIMQIILKGNMHLWGIEVTQFIVYHLIIKVQDYLKKRSHVFF